MYVDLVLEITVTIRMIHMINFKNSAHYYAVAIEIYLLWLLHFYNYVSRCTYMVVLL